MKRLIFYCLFLGVFFRIYSQSEISTSLSDSIQYAIKNDIRITAVVVLKDQVNVQALDKQLYAENANAQKRAYTVITTLQSKAEETQTSLKSYIKNKSKSEIEIIESLWIINALIVRSKPAILLEIAGRKDIVFMDIDHKSIPDPTFDEKIAPIKAPGSAEVGLKVVNADKLWKMGYTGAGRLVMNRDTGVDGNHPALAWRWRGNYVPWQWAWRGNGSFPVDGGSTGHGTHTMGTLTGLDTLTQDTIGIAFEAQWIAADFSYSSLSSFQWALNPDGDPNTIDDMPDVISNSWGISNSAGGCRQSTYAPTMNAVEAAGIAIVFSAGNEGPGAQTITGPKNINTDLVNSWATGNINGNSTGYPIRNSSSRGPSGCGGSGSLLIKPEAVAPGVNVRSAIPGGIYGFKSGTSMSCPHVSGVVTLLKQAFPNKTGHEIKLAIYHTAVETPSDLLANDPGENPGEVSGEDHTFGNGLIDAYAAYEYLAGVPNSPYELTAYSDYSTPNSMQLIWQNPTSLVNGDTLTNDVYQTIIERDSVIIDSVFGGIGTYNDINLEDGRLYHYSVYVKIDSNDLISRKSESSWTAGGSPIPQNAVITAISGGPQQIELFWQNPATNIDGTPLDDFNLVNLYQDSVLVNVFTRTTSDTGRLDSAIYFPDTPGIYHWYITVQDNEIPTNESISSNSVRSPLNVPVVEKFEPQSLTNEYYWRSVDADINKHGFNPPSGPHVLNINATPSGGDTLELYPVDLSGDQGMGLLFSFQVQPQGSGNEPPEPGDSLFLEFKNARNQWINIIAFEGDTLKPFSRLEFKMDSLSNAVNNYFHNNFQARITNIGNSHPFFPRDDWFVDNVYFGVPAPFISVDNDSMLFDSTIVGLADTSYLEIQNIGLQDFTVQNIINSNNVFSVNMTNFAVIAGGHQKLMVVFSPNATGTHDTNLKIIHDIQNNDTVNVYVRGTGGITSSIQSTDNLPRKFSLNQNYPNPFNPETNIDFALPKSGLVNLKLYNILGQEVATLAKKQYSPGTYSIIWDATKFSSGVYYYRIEIYSKEKGSELFSQTKKLVLLK